MAREQPVGCSYRKAMGAQYLYFAPPGEYQIGLPKGKMVWLPRRRGIRHECSAAVGPRKLRCGSVFMEPAQTRVEPDRVVGTSPHHVRQVQQATSRNMISVGQGDFVREDASDGRHTRCCAAGRFRRRN